MEAREHLLNLIEFFFRELCHVLTSMQPARQDLFRQRQYPPPSGKAETLFIAPWILQDGLPFVILTIVRSDVLSSGIGWNLFLVVILMGGTAIAGRPGVHFCQIGFIWCGGHQPLVTEPSAAG